jgi:hypothetical protein
MRKSSHYLFSGNDYKVWHAMIPSTWLRRVFLLTGVEDQSHLILPVTKQIKAWHKANRKMAWGITKEEFDGIEAPPLLTEADRYEGFIGVALFYGFGDDGSGNADPILSGELAWEYARRSRWRKTWQCEYIDFERLDDIRLRPGAPARPKGFYFAKFQPGKIYQSLSVSQLRKRLDRATGCGPEGIQFLAVTHPYFQGLMNKRKIPFMALADYDVAPYGFNDFFDAPQLFFSDGIFGLGIGHVDRDNPLFGIPTLRLP